MSQYMLFDTLPLEADRLAKRLQKSEPLRIPKQAEQCRYAAEQLQKHVDPKNKGADNMLLQPPTRRRLEASDSLRREARRLEQIQSTLRKLAELHESGAISPD